MNSYINSCELHGKYFSPFSTFQVQHASASFHFLGLIKDDFKEMKNDWYMLHLNCKVPMCSHTSCIMALTFSPTNNFTESHPL